MTVKFTNNASTTVGTGINASATSLTVASASSFPSLSGADDYCYLTIQGATNTTREVVKATALSSNTFTIVRAQDNTSAGTWAAGDVVELRMTAALLTDVIDAATVEGVKTNYQYTPTAGQTVFSGADNASATMIINQAALVSVYMNGVRLVQGTDYSVSSANNTVTLGIGATTADIIDIEVYGNFVGQSGAAVGITGGSITGTAITATSLGATGTATLNTLVSNNATISGGSLDGVTIGSTTRGAISGNAISGTSFASTGNMTFGDNGKAIFGADSDLQIYHDGSHARLREITGDFRIQTTSSGVNALVAKQNAEVEITYAGATKLATAATGIAVTGTATMGGLVVNSGTSDTVATFQSSDQFTDLKLTDSGGTSYIRQSNGSLILEADRTNASASSIALIKVDGAQVARFASGGDVSFYEDTGTTAKFVWDASAEMLTTSGLTLENSTAPVFRLANSSGTISAGGDLGLIEFYSDDDSGGGNAVKATMSTVQPAASPVSGEVVFKTSESTGSLTERLRVKATGIDVSGAADATVRVEATSGNDASLFLTEAGTGNVGAQLVYDGGDNKLHFKVGNNTDLTRMIIDRDTGNVGIGTTSPTVGKLQVNDSGGAILALTRTSGVASDDLGVIRFGNTDIDSNLANIRGLQGGATNSSALTFETQAAGGATTERMRIDASGRVSIGRSSDVTAKCLELQPPAQISDFLSYILNIGGDEADDAVGTKSGIGFGYTSTARPAAPATIGYETKNTGGGTYGDIYFATRSTGGTEQPTERMRITSAGALQLSDVNSPNDINTAIYSNSDVLEFEAFGTNGAIAFSTGSGVGERMRIDASGKVGIGVSAPNEKLESSGAIRVLGTTTTSANSGTLSFNGTLFNIESRGPDTSNRGTIGFYQATSNGGSGIQSMVLDASGNLGIGNSGLAYTRLAVTNSVVGANIETTSSNAGHEALIVNRQNSDGTAIAINQAGASIGSISTNDDKIIFGTANAAIAIDQSSNIILPYNPATPGARDAAIDLGYASGRFKDLYLSGSVKVGAGQGVFFGGAAGASGMTSQSLDDYEEGTFTPTVIGSATAGTATYSHQKGVYTKIGNVVTVQIYLNWSSGTGAGSLRVSNLPFSLYGVSGFYSSAAIGEYFGIAGTAGHTLCGIGLPNTVDIQFAENDFNSAPTTTTYDAAGYIIFSITYIAA